MSEAWLKMARKLSLPVPSKEEAETAPKPERKKDKRIFSLFALFFPSVMIGIIQGEYVSMLGILINTGIIYKALLVFYQFIVLKNFIESYYGESIR